MLASLLFPYDEDAPGLIDGWIGELEKVGCIELYEAGGSRYLHVTNWLIHQKIDRPGGPKFPAFDESSRVLANSRERSSGDQGPRIKDQGPRRAREAREKVNVQLNGLAEAFVKFWQAYPLKKSKGQAEKAFLQLRPDPGELDSIFAGLERAKVCDRRFVEGKFTPHAATWLNSRGWEDESQPQSNSNLAGVVMG